MSVCTYATAQCVTTDHSVSALGSSTGTSMGISGICMIVVGCVMCAQKASVYRRAVEGRRK
jgi:hypothetical protein